MSRSTRLLDLLQCLRGYRHPVSARKLAETFGVSQRTLYRDIASLMAMGAPIQGEAGLGYVLEPGFLLPPLMFTCEEIEALVLGADYVASRTDHALSQAAQSALTRIAAILPEELRRGVECGALMTGPPASRPSSLVDPSALRQAIRDQTVIILEYRDARGQTTQREIWPFAMAYFETVQILVAWCCMRAEYRHFRLDRIGAVTLTTRRYTRRKEILMKEWHQVRLAEATRDTDRN